MTANWSQYSLSELRSNAVQTFRQGGGSRPDVLLIKIAGEYAVLKDQNAADKWFARLIGPILNWRECKALTRLSGLESTPKLLTKPDSRSFLMSFHPSQQVTRIDGHTLDWPTFFTRLQSTIEAMHAAGVAHNDLRNPTNILVTPDGAPILVDLVACFCRGAAWNRPNRWLFKKFAEVDKSAIRKLKARVAPELIDETDVVAEEIAGRLGMWIKNLGKAIRKVSRYLFTSKQT